MVKKLKIDAGVVIVVAPSPVLWVHRFKIKINTVISKTVDPSGLPHLLSWHRVTNILTSDLQFSI
jgi:hypothetical protein